MIPGVVNSRHEAIVRLRVRGPNGDESEVDSIVDSGFSSALTLPAATVSALGLIRQSGGVAVLADGSVRHYEIHAADVFWDGRWLPILVNIIGDESLIGMRLLTGHELRIEVVPNGSVAIALLPQQPAAPHSQNNQRK